MVVSHHKVVGLPNHGRSRETLPVHRRARCRPQTIGLDCYPYCASSTILTRDPGGGRVEGAGHLVEAAPGVLRAWTLDDVVRAMNLPRDEAIERLRPAGAIYFSMDEADVQRILGFERTMVGSDGLPHDAAPHPRLWGTFPRVLGHYSRDLGLFPLETAVHKMTGLTAATFGLKDRGVVRAGAYADLTVFDAGTVGEAATFAQPIRPRAGSSGDRQRRDRLVRGSPDRRAAGSGARPGRAALRPRSVLS